MRWIVLALIAANAAFFAWQKNHYQPPPRVVKSAPQPGPATQNSLWLLSEVSKDVLRPRGTDAVKPAKSLAPLDENAPGGGESEGALCFSVGPLADDPAIRKVGGWLKEKNLKPVLRKDERREIAAHWVYFPPFKNRDLAVERMEQMKTEGVEDIFVIPRGDMANAVSLGVYSRRSSLDRRIAQLKDKGYQPSTAPRYRSKTASWFDIEAVEALPFDQSTLSKAFPDLELTRIGCSEDMVNVESNSGDAAAQRRRYRYSDNAQL